MRKGMFKPGSGSGPVKRADRPESIRGKISGPIPIPNPADDDEFPMRQPGTGLATPLDDNGVFNLGSPPSGASALEYRRSTSREPDMPSVSGATSRAISGSLQAPRTARSGTFRRSDVSGRPATDQSREPQRKKSTLRAAFGKIFGRKKKSLSDIPTNVPTPRVIVEKQPPPSQRQTYPTGLSRSATRDSDAKRSTSMHVTEFDRALRSHSVGEEELLAIRKSLLVEPSRVRNRSRAATYSNRVDGKGRDFGELAGLSPRPASQQGRGMVVEQGWNVSSPDNIGRAITGDTHSHRRRSRSLTSLKPHMNFNRDRKAEIKYWRESYDPGHIDPNYTTLLAQVESNPANVDSGSDESESDNESSEPVRTDQKSSSKPQPFDHNPLPSMPAPSSRITNNVSIKEQVYALTVKNQKLEKLVTQLFLLVAPNHRGAIVSNDLENESGPVRLRSTSGQSNQSFSEAQTFIESLPPLSRAGDQRPRTADHYATLLALIDEERAARQALESQVRAMALKLDTLTSQSQGGLTLSTTQSAFGRIGSNDDDDDDDTDETAFKTPREDRPLHDLAFGAFSDETGHHMNSAEVAATQEPTMPEGIRKDMRTLSLSRMTLAKPKIRVPSKPGPEDGARL